MKELQEEITQWGQDTFDNPSVLALGIRGNKEMAELISALHNEQDTYADIAEECADVAFFLLQICGIFGFDLEQEIKKKFEINKARSWNKTKDGSFQHNEEA